MVDLIKREKIRAVFSEEAFPQPLRVYIISHIASGAYTPDKFEIEMQKNVDPMVQVLAIDPSQLG